MSLSLSQLKSVKHKKIKRLGRGDATGHGTYSTRGQKGQRARTGGRKKLKRRGLKLFLLQIPKRKGFKGLKQRPFVVNLKDLESRFADGSLVNPSRLVQVGLVASQQGEVKILGDGQLAKKLNVQAHGFSKTAKDAIIKAGGTAQLIK